MAKDRYNFECHLNPASDINVIIGVASECTVKNLCESIGDTVEESGYFGSDFHRLSWSMTFAYIYVMTQHCPNGSCENR